MCSAGTQKIRTRNGMGCMRTKEEWIYAVIVLIAAIALTAVTVWGLSKPRSEPGENGFVVPI